VIAGDCVLTGILLTKITRAMTLGDYHRTQFKSSDDEYDCKEKFNTIPPKRDYRRSRFNRHLPD
jgi:hypothetical protein